MSAEIQSSHRTRSLRFLPSSFACALVAIVAFVTLTPSQPATGGPLDPVAVRTQLLYSQIYDATQWAKRVPYSFALPIVVRARLGDWLGDLELDEPVRKRVEARIQSKVLVDEIIPFLIAVKDTYSASDEAPSTFDQVIRRRYAHTEAIAGMEHSMFRWDPASADGAGSDRGGFGLDDELAARVVTLYDALYLQGASPDAKLEDELASCHARNHLPELRAAVDKTAPIVRGLVEEVRDRLELDGEFAAMVDQILVDNERLETVTATSISFTDQMVCRSYQIFATRLGREQQLRQWLQREFEKPDGGQVWSYLEHAENERRHGVLAVVDGLQGSLIEALANGKDRHSFFAAVRALNGRASELASSLPGARAAPTRQTDFLNALAGRDFQDSRYLPFFRDLYKDDGPGDRRRPPGVAVGGISTTPTISVRNLPIAWTGAPVAGPGGSGIPNFHFVDRRFKQNGDVTGRPYYFFGNDALQLLPLTREAGMQSLFDRMPQRSSFSCATQYDSAAHFSIDAFLNLAIGEAKRDFAEILCTTELALRAKNEKRLRELRDSLLREREKLFRDVPIWRVFSRGELRDRRKLARRTLDEIARLEQRTLPELLVYYNPWPDHFAHFKGPFSDEIISPSGELARLDHWLGVMSGFYRDAGLSKRTVFGMAGDHGLAPIFYSLNPEVVVFDALREDGIDFRLTKISSDEGEGPKLNNIFHPPTMKGYDVVVASTAGGNYMLDFFRDQSDNWAEQPLYRHLRDLQLIQTGNQEHQDTVRVDVVDEIVNRLAASLDYLVVREEGCDAAGGKVRVIGSPNGVRADGLIERRGDRIAYRFRDADLLDTDAATPYRTLSASQIARHARLRERCLEASKNTNTTAWCSEAEWRELASYTPRPDSVVQLAHLYDSDRAGTINLFPREGIGYNTHVPGRHAGESFYEKDAFAGVWGLPVTGRAGGERISTLVNGQVPIAVFEYLRGAPIEPGQEGFGYPSVGAVLFPESLNTD